SGLERAQGFRPLALRQEPQRLRQGRLVFLLVLRGLAFFGRLLAWLLRLAWLRLASVCGRTHYQLRQGLGPFLLLDGRRVLLVGGRRLSAGAQQEGAQKRQKQTRSTWRHG